MEAVSAVNVAMVNVDTAQKRETQGVLSRAYEAGVFVTGALAVYCLLRRDCAGTPYDKKERFSCFARCRPRPLRWWRGVCHGYQGEK